MSSSSSLNSSSLFVIASNLKQTRQGLRPTRWGPILWYYLFVTLLYWEQRDDHAMKHKLVELVKLFLVLLYCRFCRDSFNVFYAETNPEQQIESLDVVQWLHGIHEMVNSKLDKPAFPYELLQEVYLKEHREPFYWKRNQVSPHYNFCFWVVLYCTACNFPPTIASNTPPFDLQIQANASNLFHSMAELFPTTTRTKNKIAECMPRMPRKGFSSRNACFQFVYDWELAANNGKSMFGRDLKQIVLYFEQHFRTPENK